MHFRTAVKTINCTENGLSAEIFETKESRCGFCKPEIEDKLTNFSQIFLIFSMHTTANYSLVEYLNPDSLTSVSTEF